MEIESQPRKKDTPILRLLRIWLLFFIIKVGIIQQVVSQQSKVDDILKQATLSCKLGNFEEATSLLTSIEKNNLLLTGKQWSTWYDIMSKCHSGNKKRAKAIELLQTGLIRFQNNDTVKADLHFLLGNLWYQSESNYNSAILHMDSSRWISKQIYGRNNLLHLRCLNSLGAFRIDQGNYLEAKKLLQEAEILNLRKTEADILQYSRITNNLAEAYAKLQYYDKAEELIQKSLKLKQNTSGRGVDYAKSLYKLANLHFQIGLFDSARDSILEGIKIFENSYNTTDQYYPNFLVFLAIIESKSGQFESAKLKYETAINIWEKEGIIDNIPYTQSILGLGVLYDQMGDYQAAISVISQKVLPLLQLKYAKKDHPFIASALIALSKAYSSLKDYKQAETNLEEAIRILQKTVGVGHIQFFEAKLEYAKLLRKTNNYPFAKKILIEIEAIPKEHLKRISKFLSDRELSEQVKIFHDYSNEIYNLAFEYPNQADLARLAFNASLFYKGYLMENMIKIRKKIENAKQISDLRDHSIELNLQLQKELDSNVEQRANVKELHKKIELIEQKINKTLGILEESTDVSWNHIADAMIDSTELVIEYIAFKTHQSQKYTRYGALLLKKEWDAPKFIPLTTNDTIRSLLGFDPDQQTEYSSNLYAYTYRGLEETNPQKSTIYDLIWKPFEPDLVNIKSIFLVLDGLLNRISFYAISKPADKKSILLEHFDFCLYYSSRDLLKRFNAPLYHNSMDALVVGNLNYGHQSLQSPNRSGYKSKIWPALPGAMEEADSLKNFLTKLHFNVNWMSGSQVTKRALIDTLNTKKESWRLVHISTHGYYSPDSTLNDNSGYYYQRMKNSSLVLSNANHIDVQERGGCYLSALDIAKLDLPPTELVVLSACETGLGDFENYEGVLGFSRAFRLAGAEKTIISLWKVDDDATKRFMSYFYYYWIFEGEPIRAAFRKGQDKYRNTHAKDPRLWAGFILIE